MHFLFGREGNQEEGGTYPVEYRGEEKEQSTRDEARADSSTGAPCDAPRDAPAAAAATGGPCDLTIFLEYNPSRTGTETEKSGMLNALCIHPSSERTRGELTPSVGLQTHWMQLWTVGGKS